jgi:hypothetical protein
MTNPKFHEDANYSETFILRDALTLILLMNMVSS